jgi:hypothetical protein
VVIADIDGTIALRGDRGPYDETRVLDDAPSQNIIDVVLAMWLAGHGIILTSGRKEGCREGTAAWLDQHCQFTPLMLLMRADGDGRKDAIVKREMYETQIAPYYRVTAVFDDRQQVVDMWREIGLTCCQVAPGNF